MGTRARIGTSSLRTRLGGLQSYAPALAGAPRTRLPRSGRLPAELVEALPQTGDQLLAVGEVLLLGVEDAAEAALLERQHVDPAGTGLDPGRVADDVDQPVERMQAAEQIVVLAIGAREKCGEMAKADALEALDPVEALERAGVLRADAVDQDLVELADRRARW